MEWPSQNLCSNIHWRRAGFSGQLPFCFVQRQSLNGFTRAALLLTQPQLLKLWECQRVGSSFQKGCPHFLKGICQYFLSCFYWLQQIFPLLIVYFFNQVIIVGQDNQALWIRTGVKMKWCICTKCTVTQALSSPQLQPPETCLQEEKGTPKSQNLVRERRSTVCRD